MKNKLNTETSPYLLKHATNPVHWQPWGSKAFDMAKEQDKLVLISIGYSACHWCHVMEEESFEDPEIADVMNAHFICIKVDREERPDVDKIYIEAVQRISGTAGWPLNCFALPNAQPIYGGTYFRKTQWKRLLLQLASAYKTDKNKFFQAGKELMQRLSFDGLRDAGTINEQIDHAFLNHQFDKIKHRFDRANGGIIGAPKFPMPVVWNYLLTYGVLSKRSLAVDQVNSTLKHLCMGGIYDHLEGGFSRYSVDEEWFLPHFEKMLYDNSQLIGLYSEAYRHSKDEVYRKVVKETFSFLLNKLKSESGGYFSALDADSGGEEGAHYVWKKSEIEEVLGDDADFFSNCFMITKKGNWENERNILHLRMEKTEIQEIYSLSEDEVELKITELKAKLLKHRNARKKPSTDRKVILSWNAMLVSAFVNAYKAFADDLFLKEAQDLTVFLRTTFLLNGRLKRIFTSGQVKIDAVLEDYACYIQSLISMYQVSGEESYLNLANELNKIVLADFYDDRSSLFYYTSSQQTDVLMRKIEFIDNVMPSSNSIMAENLVLLSVFYRDKKYHAIAEQMLLQLLPLLKSYPEYYSNWLRVMSYFVFPIKELAVLGRDAQRISSEINRGYTPNLIMAFSKEDSDLPFFKHKQAALPFAAYFCYNNVCKEPVYDVVELNKLLQKDEG